jgi:hypothetical protein
MHPDKEILKGLADNPMLFDAVKAVLNSHFTLDYTSFSREAEAEFIGNYVRARLEGQKLLQNAFDEIASHKTGAPSPSKPNPAR